MKNAITVAYMNDGELCRTTSNDPNVIFAALSAAMGGSVGFVHTMTAEPAGPEDEPALRYLYAERSDIAVLHAVKALRIVGSLGLAEAKDMVDTIRSGGTATLHGTTGTLAEYRLSALSEAGIGYSAIVTARVADA